MLHVLANGIFSELEDTIVTSLLFRSPFYYLSHVLIRRGMHLRYLNNSFAHSLILMAMLEIY